MKPVLKAPGSTRPSSLLFNCLAQRRLQFTAYVQVPAPAAVEVAEGEVSEDVVLLTLRYDAPLPNLLSISFCVATSWCKGACNLSTRVSMQAP